MDDLTLRQEILDELEFDPSVDAASVAVAVKNGIATLAGSVGSYAEKVAAEQAALRVKGVRGVAEELKVVYPTDKKTGDTEVAQRAANVVEWNTSIPKGRVKVKVQDGWVNLTGDVEWQFQKVAAENAVRKLTGVTGISNQIKVKPTVNATNIKTHIQDALKRYAELEADAIRVEVSGNSVTLEGQVHAWTERNAAARAAWSVPGVISVADRLVVA